MESQSEPSFPVSLTVYKPWCKNSLLWKEGLGASDPSHLVPLRLWGKLLGAGVGAMSDASISCVGNMADRKLKHLFLISTFGLKC